MTEFLIYQGKAAVVLAAFYMFYRLLLSKETFHRFNRIVLLGTAALSFILPLCVITLKKVVVLPAMTASSEPIVGEVAETVAMVPEASEPVWPVILCSLFAFGALAVLVHVAISIFGIKRMIRSGSHEALESGETLIITETDTAPFSWMRYIVISREDYESGYSQILTHEKAHIALGHSWDILFVDMITDIQWFNPAIWMLKADLRAIHEFEADDAVLRSGADVKEYQYLLIRKAVSKSGYSVANSFNHSTLKARITMMSNKKSSRMSAWKALYIIPVVGISLAATAETKVDYQYGPQEPLKARVVKVHDTTDVKVIKISDESQADIPIVGVYSAIPSDDQYFEKQAEKVKVILDNAGANPNDRPIYIIDGQVQGDDFDINCLNPDFIGKVEVWSPENAEKEFGEKGKKGVISITSKEPVTIDSTADGSVKVQYIAADGSMKSSDVLQPLFVVDGQVMPEDYSLKTVKPEDIESISVLKDGKQTEVYGERAKDGVICITLKKKEEEKPVRFIPVSEGVGDLAGYTEFKLYSDGVFGKVISRKEYESIPNDALAYLYVQHLDNGKKSLHVYTLDYNSIVHLRKCRKTTDINDEKLAGVNEETVILVDGKWNNFEGYQRTLKFQSDKIKEIEYCLKKDKVSMISVIFDREYDDEEYTIRN